MTEIFLIQSLAYKYFINDNGGHTDDVSQAKVFNTYPDALKYIETNKAKFYIIVKTYVFNL